MHTPLPPLQNERVLPDAVTATLRDAILKGYFVPGERLDQDSIARELQISRTPLREALRRLEAEGFIEVRPHYGAFIAAVGPQDIHDIYEVRQLLEVEVVRQVTAAIPDTVLDAIQSFLDETQGQFEVGDTTKHFESDIYFHGTILDLAKNRLLKELLCGLTNRITIVRRFAQQQPGFHLSESLNEHYDILQAMRQRNPEQAAELMRTHLQRSALRIQELARRL